MKCPDCQAVIRLQPAEAGKYYMGCTKCSVAGPAKKTLEAAESGFCDGKLITRLYECWVLIKKIERWYLLPGLLRAYSPAAIAMQYADTCLKSSYRPILWGDDLPSKTLFAVRAYREEDNREIIQELISLGKTKWHQFEIDYELSAKIVDQEEF